MNRARIQDLQNRCIVRVGGKLWVVESFPFAGLRGPLAAGRRLFGDLPGLREFALQDPKRH